MRKFLLTAAAAATVLTGAGCSDSTGIGNVAGTYELRTINGQALPVSNQSGTRIIEAGELELDSDGTFVDIIQYRTFGSSLIQTEQFFGTWDRNGDQIELDYDNSEEVLFAERTSSNRIVLEDANGDEWTYVRF